MWTNNKKYISFDELMELIREEDDRLVKEIIANKETDNGF